MREADYVFDIGPGAGVHGGQVVSQGHASGDCRRSNGTVGHRASICPARARSRCRLSAAKGNGKKIRWSKATGNNLKKVTADFPLGKFVCVTGVSGGGKSTLTIETLFKTASMRLNGARQTPAPCETIKGLEHLDKVIDIDQRPDRAHAAVKPCDLYRRVYPDPRLVCRAARGQSAGL